MSSTNLPSNPYSPPTAHVVDVDGTGAQTQPLSVSTFKGRIGRLRYVAWMCGGYLVLFGLAAFGGLIAGIAGTPRVVDVLTGIAAILFMIFWVFWTIQRSHDMGWSGWTWLWTIIPLVVLVWIFKGGDKGANQYGGPPPPNSLGVHVLAWLLPFIFFFGVVAAVAIPAYSAYSKRANSVQTR
ncbi:DUF805 domain-containing protein [Caenimonas sp. SL110]|uniref:DUF805 domain-containing protein n=1 Tax=Caenimonas sp. SL110 TaxID=1450524 RepID=UPI000652DD8D|nr:DUF805 domain-containing protein [Caenimonas sp. SL110]